MVGHNTRHLVINQARRHGFLRLSGLSTKRSYVLGTRRRLSEMQNIVHENVSKNQAKQN